MNAVFPATNGVKSEKKTSQVNKSDVARVNAIEVQSYNEFEMNNQ